MQRKINEIKYFVPERIKKNKFFIENPYRDKISGCTFSGKSSLYNIMKSVQNPGDSVLLPAYCCSSVLEPIYKLEMVPVFYDIDLKSLNPLLASIKEQIVTHNAKIVIVPSLYGVAAELGEIESFCKDEGLFMIDDAAQSAGANLNGQYVGTFGDAGLISFSPGKNTTAPYGSFIISKKSFPIETGKKKYLLFRFLKTLQFNYCRRDVYKYYHYKFWDKVIKKLLSILKIKTVFTIKMSKSEIRKLRNNLLYTLNFLNPKRVDVYTHFYDCFKGTSFFNFIRIEKGSFSPSKIVLIFHEKDKAKNYMNYLKNNSIASRNGYKLLTNDLESLPNCRKIEGCVVELPIELNRKRMEYLIKITEGFILT